MLWKHETKQLLRTPLRTLIFCLALAVVIGLLCVTLGLRLATERWKCCKSCAKSSNLFCLTLLLTFLDNSLISR